MENNIIREYPAKKQNIIFDTRYTLHHFENYKDIKQNNFKNYELWKSGINYKTNRKIKIGGKLHKKLGYKFYIKYDDKKILFTLFDDMNINDYLKESEKIENDKKEIEKYNLQIDNVIKNINLLETWEQYVIFDNKKYGVHHSNIIHKENNCFGIIERYKYESCMCSCCENWGGCCRPESTSYYVCKKCGYNYSDKHTSSRNYKGK